MRTLLLALCIAMLSSQASAIKFWTYGTDTLVIYGNFAYGDTRRISTVDFSKIKKLIIDSGGGEMNEAISTAYLIHSHNLPVIVAHECLSACAFWIFLPAIEKHLGRGAVLGLHSGTPHFDINDAMIAAARRVRHDSNHSTPRELHDEMMIKSGINQQIFMDTWKKTTNGKNPALVLEYKNKHGEIVKFAMTTNIEKNIENYLAMKNMEYVTIYQDDLIEHTFWFPTKTQLESYGVKGIVEYDDPKTEEELKPLEQSGNITLFR